MWARIRKVITMVLAFLLVGGVAAAEQDLEAIAAGIARDYKRRLEEYWGLAEEIVRQGDGRLEERLKAVARRAPRPDGERVLLFITLGEKAEERVEENRRLLREIRETSPEAVVVLRGLPVGCRTLGEAVRYLKRVADKDGPPVLLNPLLFRRYGVTVAPTLVYERDGAAVAQARGIINARWLLGRVEKEKATGDLGKWGETVAIAERDMIEEMQSRLAAVDWEAKKRQAVANFWRKPRLLELPPAQQDKVFYLDAAYQVERDFVLPDGKVLARAGEKINLFKVLPPTFYLVVFDARDPRQVAWAKQVGREQSARRRVKYLVTAIPEPEERGWEVWERLHEEMGAPVYLLDEMVRERFQLRHAPSTVGYVKEKERFEVREVCLRRAPKSGF